VSRSDPVVVGIGNPYRRDDGIGPALADAVEALGLPGVRTATLQATTSDLLHTWAGASLAVVVDAVRCEPSSPGRIHRVDPGAIGPPELSVTPASTHELSLEQAVRLGQLLALEPARLVVFAVEAADLGHGQGFSPAVDAALPILLRAVAEELGQPA
jgi:hydrogenase maturation protease